MSKYIQFEVFQNFKVGYISTLFSSCITWIGMENCSNLCVITTVYFEDRKWISKTVFCISSSMVCKIVFCSEFFNIPDNAAKVSHEKKDKNRDNCKALCVSCKRSKFKILVLLKLKIYSKVYFWKEGYLELIVMQSMRVFRYKAINLMPCQENYLPGCSIKPTVALFIIKYVHNQKFIQDPIKHLKIECFVGYEYASVHFFTLFSWNHDF